jgi:hypothetical protein
MSALPDVSTPLPRLAGSTVDHPDIVGFLHEFREFARTRPKITAAHIEYVETALANACHAASGSVDVLELWDGVRDVITRRDTPVKWRLEEMGRVAAAWNLKRRGASH